MTAHEVKPGWFARLARIMSTKGMRPVTRFFTNAHVALYRWTGGWAQAPQYPTLLLTVRGRKTGKPRTIPLVYVMDGERFVIAAAYAGSDQNPVWWLNLQASGEGVVQVRRRTVQVRAQVASPEEKAVLWPKLVAMYPYFTEYQGRTQRQIPVVILTPAANRQRIAPHSDTTDHG